MLALIIFLGFLNGEYNFLKGRDNLKHTHFSVTNFIEFISPRTYVKQLLEMCNINPTPLLYFLVVSV